MAQRKIFINALAESLLLGKWQKADMQQGIDYVVNHNVAWKAPELLSRIHERFKSQYPDILLQDLVAFIAQDAAFNAIWQQHRHHSRIYQYNIVPLPCRQQNTQWDLPALDNIKILAQWLGLSFGQLENYAANHRQNTAILASHLQHYWYHALPKSNGDVRLIEAPKSRMAAVQKQIYLGLLQKIPLHPQCHGFRKGYGCQSYVHRHTGKHVVMRMDLQNFFCSVPYRRIVALFLSLGYGLSIARKLAGICCNTTPLAIVGRYFSVNHSLRQQFLQAHLPQGSPSSPALANLAAFNLDVRLNALAEKLNGQYSRYADDLAFSGGRDFNRHVKQLPVLIAHIAADEGFIVNHRKTRIMYQSGRQKLAGLSVNEFANISRKDYEQLKAILFNCVRYGADSQNKRNLPNFKQHLQGRVAYVYAHNPGKGRKLQKLWDEIAWSPP